MASERIIKMSLGRREQLIIFQHKRKWTSWGKKALAVFRQVNAEVMVEFLPLTKTNALVMFCVFKKLKKKGRNSAFISLFLVCL